MRQTLANTGRKSLKVVCTRYKQAWIIEATHFHIAQPLAMSNASPFLAPELLLKIFEQLVPWVAAFYDIDTIKSPSQLANNASNVT